MNKTFTLEELRLAQAKGCRIETQSEEGKWLSVDIPVESLIGFHIYTFRIHPADEWKARLPRLKDGAEWCHSGERLSPPARPMIVGERVGIWSVKKGEESFTNLPVPTEFLHKSELAAQPPGTGAARQAIKFWESKSSTPAPDYGEPWSLREEYHACPFLNRYGLIAQDKEEQNERIIACVNALSGVPDPAAFVAEAKEMREAIKEAQEAINNLLLIAEHGMPSTSHEGSCGPWSPCDSNCEAAAHCAEHLHHAQKTLAKLQPFLT